MRPVPILILIALAFAAPSMAEGSCVPSTSPAEVDTAHTGLPLPSRYYVDIDIEPDWPIEPWIYEESNGMDGLQRQDARRDDTCGGQIPPDTLIW